MRPTSMSRGIGARRSVRALGVLTATVALLTPAAAANAANTGGQLANTEELTYTCLEEPAVCEAGVVEAAGSSAASTAAAVTAAAPVGGYGYLISPSGPRRYYGWRLSRNIATGELIPFSRCALLNGRPVHCRFIGRIGFQAEYHLRNRYVSDMETKVFNQINEPFGVRPIAICRPPSAECIARIGSIASLSPAPGSATHSLGPDFQLTTAGGFSIAFALEVDDPVTRTRARSQLFGSMSFTCRAYRPPTNPGDCFFEGGFPGGNH